MDIVKFSAGKPRMLFRRTINAQPGEHPNRAECSSGKKSNLPMRTVGTDDEWDYQGRHDCAHIRTCIEHACRKRALPFWKPFRDRLNACRKIPGFAKTKTESGGHEAGQAKSGPDRGMEHPEDAPQANCEHISQTHSNLIDKPAHQQETHRASALK